MSRRAAQDGLLAAWAFLSTKLPPLRPRRWFLRRRSLIVVNSTRHRKRNSKHFDPRAPAEPRFSTMKIPFLSLANSLAGLLLCGVTATASAQMTINGAGATLYPYPISSEHGFDAYAQVDPSVRFNYQSIGSGGGQKQILAQTVDFGASDGPMSDENWRRRRASCFTSRPSRAGWLSPTTFGAARP